MTKIIMLLLALTLTLCVVTKSEAGGEKIFFKRVPGFPNIIEMKSYGDGGYVYGYKFTRTRTKSYSYKSRYRSKSSYRSRSKKMYSQRHKRYMKRYYNYNHVKKRRRR